MTLIWITLEIINLWNFLHNIRNSLRQKYILFIDFICSNTKYQIHLAEVIITVLPVTPILHTVFCQHPKLFSSLTLKISISFLFSIWKNIFIDRQIFLIFTESFNLSPLKAFFKHGYIWNRGTQSTGTWLNIGFGSSRECSHPAGNFLGHIERFRNPNNSSRPTVQCPSVSKLVCYQYIKL